MPPVRSKDTPHLDFARRLEQAVDSFRDIPSPNFGRLRWFQEQVELKTGVKPTPETVRRWTLGQALPRKAAQEALAEILKVDVGWLVFGEGTPTVQFERKLQRTEVDGVVNILAGVIQMDGGHPAFPTDDEKSDADLFAIIRGANYSFKVVLGEQTDGGFRFSVPPKVKNLLLLGVVRSGQHSFAFYELEHDRFAAEGERNGAQLSLTLDPASLRQIESFGQRL